MTKEELAKLLDGREYNNEISKEEELQAKENGLVVVFGASDDLMEFRGAIYDEASCYDGGFAYLDESGLLENKCDNDDCPYFERLKQKAKRIEAVWCPKDRDGNIISSWTYQTDIPHAKFDIREDDELYCIGIVFNINDLN